MQLPKKKFRRESLQLSKNIYISADLDIMSRFTRVEFTLSRGHRMTGKIRTKRTIFSQVLNSSLRTTSRSPFTFH